MIKYGYIKDYNKFVSESQKMPNEYIWDFERIDDDSTERPYIGIEFTSRVDFSNIEVVGTAADFASWVRKNGSSIADLV